MEEVVVNTAANILAALLLLIGGWLLSFPFRLPFVYRKRKKLLDFFGIKKDKQSLIVYLSTVYVLPGGSVDFRGLQRTFSGPAIPAAELGTINVIGEIFHDTFLDSLSPNLRERLSRSWHWSFSEITPVASASPFEQKNIEKSNIIVVGSQYYNSVGDLYTETGSPMLKFEQQGEDMIICVTQGPRKGDVFQVRPNQLDDIAIVERLQDRINGTTIFFTAGRGVIGTLGATQYLADNWVELHRTFGTQDFAIVLRFQDIGKDPDTVRKPVELARFSK